MLNLTRNQQWFAHIDEIDLGRHMANLIVSRQH